MPIANPSSQRGLIQLAVTIAVGNVPLPPHQQPAIVSPLSLIQLGEDYVYESTPAEAERLIAQRQAQLDELVQSIEPPGLSQASASDYSGF